mmetsp:Transcript_30568/g.97775  ORF Transcript_30568/g.97775 Transcript_30568/m.97775 type:complete len:189 (+) Transcript_30568:28-594(+)
MPRVLVPIADASEEIELSCTTDTLVRGGVEVVTASVMPEGRLQVKCARGLTVVADKHIDECCKDEWDAIALPGGMPGAKHLSENARLTELLKAQVNAGKCTAAICAAPAVVLKAHGLLPASFTHFPAPPLKEKTGAGYSESLVVVDGCVVTSQGPGTALPFGLKLVELLVSREKAEEVAKGLLNTEVP